MSAASSPLRLFLQTVMAAPLHCEQFEIRRAGVNPPDPLKLRIVVALINRLP